VILAEATPCPEAPGDLRRRRYDRGGRRRCTAVGWCLDDLPRDYHLLDILEARQIEHDIEQGALHDRPQSARHGLALDQLRTRSYALFQSTRGVKTLPPSSRRAQVLCALPLAVRPLNNLR
jgi:hypothetical protein